MKKHLTYLIAAILGACFLGASAEEVKIPEPGLSPEAPRAWQFRQVMMPAPALSTGAATFEIPLYEIEARDFSLPLALRYHAGGIRVDDDCQPIGLGWTLTPPLRITRQILGRPDGLFPFVDDKDSPGYFSDYNNCRNCVLNQQTPPAHQNNRHDSEHDLFTVHLADRSFGMIFDHGRIVTANNDEYRIETDSVISYIKITDPSGNIYNFSKLASFTPAGYNTEWLPISIKTLTGKELKFTWHVGNRVSGNAYNNSLTAHLGYPPVIQKDVIDYDFFSVAPGANISDIFDFGEIDFGDGQVVFSYDNSGMLTSLSVKNSDDETIRQISLSQGHGNKFLSELVFDQESKYTFEYCEGFSFAAPAAQDWWGYPNGETTCSSLLSPTVKITSPGFCHIDGADRSVNADYNAGGMLKKATYPTGAVAEWEYELHKFNPDLRHPVSGSLKVEQPAELTQGGGVRVKSLTLYNGADDPTPVKKTYVYGEDGSGMANVVSLPLLHTFLTMNLRKDIYQDSHLGILLYEEFLVTIANHSDYMAGRPGETPIWYSQVKEVEGEGYTIYNYEKLWKNNTVWRTDEGPFPTEIFTAFSSGIVEKSREIYDQSGKKLSTLSKEYRINGLDSPAWHSKSISRKCIQNFEATIAPDFDENRRVVAYFFNGQTSTLASLTCEEDNYTATDYAVFPYTEQLVSETATEHTSTGDIARTTTFEYVGGTNLLCRKTIKCGPDSIVSVFDYTDSDASVAAAMKKANAVGTVIGGTTTYQGSVASSRYEMKRYGSAFKPTRVWRSRGGNAEWSNISYCWNSNGTMASRTDAANVTTSWTWDTHGRYPLSSTVGGILTNRAQWKKLVGVTAIISPDSVKQQYAYDARGRLTSVSHSGNRLETYAYKVSQDGDNYILNRKHSGSATSAAISCYSRFDAMGVNGEYSRDCLLG